MEKIDCIYLMGGIGERAKLGFPKQFQMLGSKPIFIHGLEILNDIPEIHDIIIVSNDIAKTQDIINQYSISNKGLKYVGNGETRQQSVFNGIGLVETENVLISEGVRPFISRNLYKKIIDDKAENITPIKKSVSTVIDRLGHSYDRKDFGEVQMPQKFNTSMLKDVHKLAIDKKCDCSTDDIDLMYVMTVTEKSYDEYNVKVIEGEEQNIKITSPLDLVIAEAIYEKIINSNGVE